MRRWTIAWLLVLGVTGFTSAVAHGWGKAPSTGIRISILKNVPNLSILGRDLSVWDPVRREMLFKSGESEPLSIAWRDLGMQVNRQIVRVEKIVIRSRAAAFRVGGKNLRGELEVVRREAGGLSLINHLDLEDYLTGLINHEISSSWPEEAVKAQAVVARTYALYRKNQGKYVDYDLESSTLDQVYGGSNLEDKGSRAAVEETRGEVLAYEGEVIAAFYSSCCGGHTELPQYVWGGNYGGISAVTCGYCEDAPAYFWKKEWTIRELQNLLAKNGTPMATLSSIQITRSTPYGRALDISFSGGGKEMKLTGNQLRALLGFENVKSTYFRLSDDRRTADSRWGPDTRIRFTGGGNGHGVGLCQWGARGMAEKGFSYKKILKHYYPEAKLTRAKKS